jgi:hypothetical protein
MKTKCPSCNCPVVWIELPRTLRRGDRKIKYLSLYWRCTNEPGFSGEEYFEFEDAYLAKLNDQRAKEAWLKVFNEELPERTRVNDGM